MGHCPTKTTNISVALKRVTRCEWPPHRRRCNVTIPCAFFACEQVVGSKVPGHSTQASVQSGQRTYNLCAQDQTSPSFQYTAGATTRAPQRTSLWRDPSWQLVHAIAGSAKSEHSSPNTGHSVSVSSATSRCRGCMAAAACALTTEPSVPQAVHVSPSGRQPLQTWVQARYQGASTQSCAACASHLRCGFVKICLFVKMKFHGDHT